MNRAETIIKFWFQTFYRYRMVWNQSSARKVVISAAALGELQERCSESKIDDKIYDLVDFWISPDGGENDNGTVFKITTLRAFFSSLLMFWHTTGTFISQHLGVRVAQNSPHRLRSAKESRFIMAKIQNRKYKNIKPSEGISRLKVSKNDKDRGVSHLHFSCFHMGQKIEY